MLNSNPTGIETNLTPKVYSIPGNNKKCDGYEINMPDGIGVVPDLKFKNSQRAPGDITINSDSPDYIYSQSLYMFAVYDSYTFTTENYGDGHYINNAPNYNASGPYTNYQKVESSGGLGDQAATWGGGRKRITSGSLTSAIDSIN